jgi:hypothetical protein
MGMTLTLTDAELPASPAFIEFLHTTLSGGDYHAGEWFDQQEENLVRDEGRFEDIKEKAQFVSRHPKGKQMLLRSYRFFKELLTGNVATLEALQRFHFFFVIGIPRTGGTYLTKQLFRACGIDYRRVQNALAHDGFPHLANLSFKDSGNLHTNGLLQLAEYLTMVEIFFTASGKLSYRNGIIVPKKFTKAVYYFDLIRELFGDNADFLITIRHPLSFCQSVIDKSGGMPENCQFAVRSAIERWAMNDMLHQGMAEEEIRQMNYIECMLGYWKRFHFQLAMSGIPSMPRARVVPFGASYMTDAVADYYRIFNVELQPEPFKVAEPPQFDDRDTLVAGNVVGEVEAFWSSMGMQFPTDAIAEMY